MPLRLTLLLLILVASAQAFPAEVTPEIQARAILEHAVNTRTVAGAAQVPVLAAWLAEQLRASGFAPGDVDIQTYGETAALIARYRGTGNAAPLVVSAHMDVVEANPEDWERDPFVLTEENGFLYGRGVMDNKFELSMVVTTLARFKREGYVPARDIVLALSGDEETSMISTRAITPQLRGTWLVINTDGDANPLGSDGKPLAFKLQAAEKTYASFELRAHNPGGHSSRPHADNAIYQLAHALIRLQQHAFPVQLNEVTRAYLRGLAGQETGAQRTAMEQLAKNPADAQAGALLSADPEYVGILRTTCVATMLNAGHAENALPQRAVATVNCRILPGTPIDSVRDTLVQVIADPGIEIELLDRYPEAPASPLRNDVTSALRQAVDIRYPGLQILPSMAAGASDNMYFRAAGIDSYCVTSLFMHPEDDFAHGLNERVPADAIAPALAFWNVLLRELAASP